MRALVCGLTIVLLSSCQSRMSNRGTVDATSDTRTTQPDPCAGKTSPSPQCPDDTDDTDDTDGDDERCSKDCDEICDSWRKNHDFSSYEGDVSTCSDNSYTLTRTGTRSRTCPDITCAGTKKECPTTETIKDTKEKECRCPTIVGEEICSMVGTCLERACEDGGQRCRHRLGACTKWGEKEVCTEIDDSDNEEACYDW